MAAPRLLVLADPKLLPALANGLREGGRFDVMPVPLSDGGAAAAAAPRADAVAVFYGAKDRPLAATVQMLAPAVRGKGGRLVAVLQREAAAQRDECFRAGACDLLFMPMKKEQFVTRLEAAVALSFTPAPGTRAEVQVSSRMGQVKIAAVVSTAGVQATTSIPFPPGETVRLSLDPGGTHVQLWGLVATSSPEARIRFAGLTPDEEARLQEWLKKGATAPASEGASRPAVPGAPLSGPPPGFTDRPRIRGESGASAAKTKPPGGPVPLPAAAAPAPPARAQATDESELPTPPLVSPLDLAEKPAREAGLADAGPGPAAPAGGVDASIFEGIQTPASVPQAPPAVEPVVWPVPVALDVARRAVLAALFPTDDKPEAPQEVVLSAQKVAASVSGAEKSAIERLGSGENHFADAAAERVALDVARAEGTRLAAASEPSKVDDAVVKALTQRVDAVVARLQKDAEIAVTKGELDALQVVRASSAALSRDLISFKAVADRLRGLAAAPRLGAGALDPEIVLPGQAPRPPPPKAVEAPVRAELREFEKFQEAKPGARRKTMLVVVAVVLVAAVIYVASFNLPRVTEIDGRTANIPNVVRIDVGGAGARVVVSDAFVAKPEPALSQLISLLRERKVESAALVTAAGTPVGQIDVKTGATFGIAGSKKPEKPTGQTR